MNVSWRFAYLNALLAIAATQQSAKAIFMVAALVGACAGFLLDRRGEGA